MNYDWNFSPYWAYRNAFLTGIITTVELSTLSALIGTFVGFPLGILLSLRAFKSWLYIANDIFRAIPILVLLFFFYYFPYKETLGITPLSAFSCSLLALSFSQATFTADIVASAIKRFPPRLLQAAQTLGLPQTTIWKNILLPNVIRNILPSLIGFCIGLLKLSSIASVIGCQDIVFVTRVATGQTFRSLEGWVLVGIVYIVLVLPTTALARCFEDSKWLKRHY